MSTKHVANAGVNVMFVATMALTAITAGVADPAVKKAIRGVCLKVYNVIKGAYAGDKAFK